MMPLAAAANSHFLTYASCGAWSQAIASIVPSWIPCEDRHPVVLAAQRRVHLRVRVVPFERRVGQGEVLGSRLARDVETGATGHPEEIHPHPGADMLDVQLPSRLAGDQDVPGDGDLFRGGGDPGDPELPGGPPLVRGAAAGQDGILRVGEDPVSEGTDVLHRAPKQEGVLHRFPVVRKRHRSGVGQFASSPPSLSLRARGSPRPRERRWRTLPDALSR